MVRKCTESEEFECEDKPTTWTVVDQLKINSKLQEIAWYCSRAHTYNDVRQVAQHGNHNQNDAKLFFVSFVWLRPIDLTKRFQRTNKKKSQKQESIWTEVARKIAKGGENGTEHCHEVERVKQMKQILNNAVKQGDKELEKGGEIPEKLTQRCTELPKLIAVVELIYSRGRTVAQFIR